MLKIIVESIQEVDSFLKNEMRDLILEEFPEVKKNPASGDDISVINFAVDQINSKFPDEVPAEVAEVAVVKVQGEETEILSTDHRVVKFNGYLYDYTAHQFNEEFNGLMSYDQMPVIQSVITSDAQINDGVSTVKYYAMIEY